ncbi:C69 family dipeptidase [Lacticaseibacillus pantheris]
MIQPRSSCTSILIGRKATADGSVMIGRNEDLKASWPKHFVVHPAQTATQPTTFTSAETGVVIPLPDSARQYTATPEWTDQYGLFEEDGINDAGVAMSATESAYANPLVLSYDPFTEHGINEEAMVTIVLPYVDSARAGVQRLGALVEEYGTGEANGILFADNQEAWYMEIATGHHWLAQRIPDDAYAVASNQLSIEVVDPDSDDFMLDPTLIDFAQTNQLWQPGTPFNWRQIFGTHTSQDRMYNNPRVWDGHRLLTQSSIVADPESFDQPFIMRADRPLRVADATAVLSAHFQDTPFDPAARIPDPANAHRYRPISLAKTQESHVLQMRSDLPAAVANIHWLAMGVAAESQYVPFYAGADTTPADYQRGGLPANLNSAYWQYKLAGVLVDAHWQRFSPRMVKTQEDVAARLLAHLHASDAQAKQLQDADALVAFANQSNAERAQLSAESWRALSMGLLSDSTDDSPLNFAVDPQL